LPELRDLVARELSEPVDSRVTAMAAAIAGKHGSASRAVLFYGSALREREIEAQILDFYLIVSDYRAAYEKRWLATANRLIPPNVFYFEHEGFASKYAVLSESDFARECSPSARTSSVFARFSQPTRLVWVADETAGAAVVDSVADAAPTLLELSRPTMTDRDAADALAIWNKAFVFTYGSELRAERNSRPALIVDSDPERYRRFAVAAGFAEERAYSDEQRRRAQATWRRFQRRGKRASVLRLAKASFTFAGGADYIAWKINRHAGTAIRLKPWQQRHPLLAGLTLLPRLLRSGAVR
jgi:hypothetical protein